MIVKDGRIVAIDHVEVDGITITGDGIFPKKCGGKPLGVGPGVVSAISGQVVKAVSAEIDKQIDKQIDKKLYPISAAINNLSAKVNTVSSNVETLKKTVEEKFDEISDWADTVDEHLETNDTRLSTAEEKIRELESRPAGSSAVLSKDLFVTNNLGTIPKYSTISAGTSLESIWTSALSVTINPVAGDVKTNLQPLYEYPTVQNLTSISFKATAGNYPITGYAFKIGNGKASTGTTAIAGVDSQGTHAGTMTSSVSVSVSSPITVYASAFDGTTNKIEQKTSINFCWPYFYGVGDSQEPDFSSLTKIVETKGDKTVKYSTKGKYLYFAFVDETNYKDIAKIESGPYDYIDSFEKKDAMYESKKYKLYVTKEVKTFDGNCKFIHGT